MIQGESFFQKDKTTRIFTQKWLPEDSPKGIILIVHGLAEHSGRYSNLINHLAPAGYAFYSLDHIGHGKSDGKRAFVQSFNDYIQPLRQLHQEIKEAHSDIPVYLFGHSMGGLIAANYLLQYQEEIKGAVLSAPAIKVPEHITPTIVLAGKILSNLIPAFRMIQLEAEGMSRDLNVVEAYEKDPLVFRGKVTARLGAELLKAMQKIADQASEIQVPFLVMQGSEDRLVEPDGAEFFYTHAGSQDKKLKIYEGLYHELINEPEKELVLNEIQEWLESH